MSASTSTAATSRQRHPQCSTMRCRCVHLTLRRARARADDPVCVLQKRVAYSDKDKVQHRLLLPREQLDRVVLEQRMTAAEKAQTRDGAGLPVKVFGRFGREYNLILKYVTSIKAYRIMGPEYMWLVKDSGFLTGHFLHLWVFRAHNADGASTSANPGGLSMAIINHAQAEQDETVEMDADPEVLLAAETLLIMGLWKRRREEEGSERREEDKKMRVSEGEGDDSRSDGSGPSVSESTSTSSTIVNEQRRQPRKRIAYSDVNCKQHRLLLPKDQLDKAALEGTMTAAEKMRATDKSGLPIRILDREGREYNLILKFVASIKTYRIMGADYMKLVDGNQFQTGHFLDLWVYRIGERGSGGDDGIAAGELRMATINHKKAEEEEDVEMAADDRGRGASADEPPSTGGGRASMGEEKTAAAAHADVLAAWTLVALSRGSQLEDIGVL
ncbi:hypothetical protein BHM03_00001805 [Ensete ventricosum]|nr:hypothetical protein BHM03_00001805 [Ensete ventricosum]